MVGNEESIHPFGDDTVRLLRHGRMPLHTGTGRIGRHGDPDHPLSKLEKLAEDLNGQPPDQTNSDFEARCLLPASGDCIIMMRWESAYHLSRNFGQDLVITGKSPDGDFTLNCPKYYVSSTSESRETPGWSVASPVNAALTINYGLTRPICSVEAIINNFDFDHGNVSDATYGDGVNSILRVKARGQNIDFRKREDYQSLRRLLDVGSLRTTALLSFSFGSWENATEEDLIQFTYDVSSLCSLVAKQHTSVPVITLMDTIGKPVNRVIRNPVESNFRKAYLMRHLCLPEELPQLFEQSFEEFVLLRKSTEWQRLFALCAAIEDPPYLEQKLSTLMTAVEMLLKNSLVERGVLTRADAEAKPLPGLISSARRNLAWTIPSHYTKGDKYRLLRNAVAHGSEMPVSIQSGMTEFLKWQLFLLRSILLRIKFTGKVASPEKGWASRSDVHEFSENHNSFST